MYVNEGSNNLLGFFCICNLNFLYFYNTLNKKCLQAKTLNFIILKKLQQFGLFSQSYRSDKELPDWPLNVYLNVSFLKYISVYVKQKKNVNFKVHVYCFIIFSVCVIGNSIK